MPTLSERPKSGLNVDQALEKWSDQQTYGILVEIAGTRDLPTIGHSGRIGDLSRRKEYEKLRAGLEQAFLDLLLEGKVLGSAILDGGDGRTVIESSLWELLEINYDLHEVNGNDRKYRKPEFFDPALPPLNILSLPEWLRPREPPQTGIHVFQPEQDYRHIFISHTFTLGEKCAKVVALLHDAALRDEPWQVGKLILEQAGSIQLKLPELFKDVVGWDLLIEADGRGQYRLRQR